MKKDWAVLWDVDGTLVDTAELHFQAWVKLAAEIGKPFSRDDFKATFGWRNPEIIPTLFGAEIGAAEIQRLGERKENFYRAEASKGIELLPGVRSLLDNLGPAGTRQGIGSSAPRANIDLILEITNTANHFGAVVAMEDVHHGKPAPDVFLLAGKRLGVPAERCIVIEDAPVGIQAAKAAGMRAVAVTFIGHHSTQSLRSAGADLVLPTLAELNVSRLAELVG